MVGLTADDRVRLEDFRTRLFLAVASTEDILARHHVEYVPIHSPPVRPIESDAAVLTRCNLLVVTLARRIEQLRGIEDGSLVVDAPAR